MFTHTWMKLTLFNIYESHSFRKGTISDMSHKRRITYAPTSSLLLVVTASCCRSCLPLSLMSPQMANSTSKWIASMLKKNTLYVCPSLISAIGMNYKNTLTVALALVFNRKLAVCAAAGGWLGIGRWPSAMPTIAVMWVSVPKTWMGIPVVFPVAMKRETKRWRNIRLHMYGGV